MVNKVNRLTEKDLDELFEELDLFEHGFLTEKMIDDVLEGKDSLEEIMEDFHWDEDDDERTPEDFEVLNDPLFKKYF